MTEQEDEPFQGIYRTHTPFVDCSGMASTLNVPRMQELRF